MNDKPGGLALVAHDLTRDIVVASHMDDGAVVGTYPNSLRFHYRDRSLKDQPRRSSVNSR
jgi:hypothetical protein